MLETTESSSFYLKEISFITKLQQVLRNTIWDKILHTNGYQDSLAIIKYIRKFPNGSLVLELHNRKEDNNFIEGWFLSHEKMFRKFILSVFSIYHAFTSKNYLRKKIGKNNMYGIQVIISRFFLTPFELCLQQKKKTIKIAVVFTVKSVEPILFDFYLYSGIIQTYFIWNSSYEKFPNFWIKVNISCFKNELESHIDFAEFC